MIRHITPLRSLTFLISLLLASINLDARTDKRPNIIIILSDDQGYADLGAYGLTDDIRTPHLDQLAKNGALMTNGYASAAQCIPSRAGIISGKYQNRVNLEKNEQAPLSTEVITVAQRMKESGYATGFIGKWHLEPNRNSQDWKKENWPEGFGNNKPPSHKMRLPYMPINRGYSDVFDGTMNSYFKNYNMEGESIPETKEVDKKTFRVDKQTEAALAFIKKNKESPFFLQLSYFAPHVPLEVTKKYFDRFPGEMAERRRWGLASISAIDDGVGGIMAKLREYNLEEDTLIFFFSDNGAPLKIHMKDDPFKKPGWDGSINGPLVGEKGMIADGGVRVPYLVYWKGKIKPQVFKHPVITLDAPATALHLAGVEVEEGDVDGVNLMPFLQEETNKLPHKDLFWRFWGQSAVRSGKWKYMYLGNDVRMLFDMESPEGEKKNIINQFPEKAQELEAKLEKWCNTLPKKGLPTKSDYGREHNWFKHYYADVK